MLHFINFLFLKRVGSAGFSLLMFYSISGSLHAKLNVQPIIINTIYTVNISSINFIISSIKCSTKLLLWKVLRMKVNKADGFPCMDASKVNEPNIDSMGVAFFPPCSCYPPDKNVYFKLSFSWWLYNIIIFPLNFLCDWSKSLNNFFSGIFSKKPK